MATRVALPQAPATAVDEDLVVDLEIPLPAAIPVGQATAVICFGTCFHRRQAIERLEVVVDGVPHRPTAARMPRLDLFRALHPSIAAGEEQTKERDPLSGEDPECRSYRSGFWATVPIPAPRRPGAVELRVAVEFADGTRTDSPLGAIAVAPGDPAQHRSSLIAICMATFDPDPELFRAQVDSIRAQTDGDWICLISDDCSHPDRFAEIERVVEGDARFVVSRSPRRLGFYRNFERALELAPPEAGLVALADQDDLWHPDKLQALRAGLGRAQLIYSDQRIVDGA